MTIRALAPMDGITGSAMRSLVLDIFKTHNTDPSKELWMFTEFMSSEGYLRNPQRLSKHLLTTNDQYNSKVVAQIYGGNPDNLIHTAIDVDQKYDFFTGIELNIGCPSPKVMACEAGSGMLKDRSKTLEIIKSISSNIKKPFSIKTRCGLTTEDKASQFDFILNAAQYCSMITIHGRTYKQSHSGEVDWDFIYRVKQAVISINPQTKIIGNGGILSYEDGEQKLGTLDGVMFGQAAMMNPRVLVSHIPSILEIYGYVIKFLHYYIACDLYFFDESARDNETLKLQMPTIEQINQIITILPTTTIGQDLHSVVEFRKHLFWAVTGLPGNKEFKNKLATLKQYSDVINAIHSYFEPLLLGKHLEQ